MASWTLGGTAGSPSAAGRLHRLEAALDQASALSDGLRHEGDCAVESLHGDRVEGQLARAQLEAPQADPAGVGPLPSSV
jgi:hypothetical protein